jgi:hypothetical protein
MNRAEKMCNSGIGGNKQVSIVVSDKAVKMCSSGVVKKPVVVEESVVGISFDGSEVVVDDMEFGVEETVVSINDHVAAVDMEFGAEETVSINDHDHEG